MHFLPLYLSCSCLNVHFTTVSLVEKCTSGIVPNRLYLFDHIRCLLHLLMSGAGLPPCIWHQDVPLSVLCNICKSGKSFCLCFRLFPKMSSIFVHLSIIYIQFHPFFVACVFFLLISSLIYSAFHVLDTAH